MSDQLPELKALIERALADHLERRASARQGAERLHEAMRYSLLAGGKRLRPLLALAAARAVGADAARAIPVAVALELIHTYSLVHDDLPAMDDDDLRRGKPTCHVAYDEATAILVGDALLTLAFEVLADPQWANDIGASRAVAIIAEMASAAGAQGMVGGQAHDMGAEGRTLTLDELRRLHALKTGALIRAAVVAGGLAGGANEATVTRLREFGETIGLAFQIVDDVLDVESDTATLGKPQGSDAKNSKSTFVSLLGLDASKREAARLLEAAMGTLAPLSDGAQALRELARMLVERRS